MNSDLGLIPKWEINQTLEYVIYKYDNFIYKDKQGEKLERTYRLHTTRISETEAEAYFPDGILSGIKLTSNANRYLKNVDHEALNMIRYIIDEDGGFEELKDIDQCVANIAKLKEIFKKTIDDDDPDDIIGSLEMFEKFPHIAESKLSEDIETLHDYYGADIYDGYLFNLEDGDRISKSIPDKILGFLKIKLGKMHLLQTDFLNNGDYQLELLKGSDTISDLKRQNINLIKELFLNHEFNAEEIEDFTCRHQKYLYGKNDFILKNYSSHFKLSSSLMDKQIRIEMRRVC